MKYACIFRDNYENRIRVSAEDIKNGKYSRYNEFVDFDYEYKVQYVKAARNNGGPYFRFYYSYEEYKKLHPDGAERYREIVENMRHYRNSAWHDGWQEKVDDFCSIEHCIKNDTTEKWKFADAYYEKTKTCIEFQHSYISFDFEERNDFYAALDIKMVWLYDLSNLNVCKSEDGMIEILEDNARGFFRISENAENLKNHRVYIQVKNGTIYRVEELRRRDSSKKQKSTIRYFQPTEVYTEEEFIAAIRNNTIGFDRNKPKPIEELWSNTYSWMKVKKIDTGDVIRVNRDNKGGIFRDYSTGCIKYVYVNDVYTSRKKEYRISHRDERCPIWQFIYAAKCK